MRTQESVCRSLEQVTVSWEKDETGEAEPMAERCEHWLSSQDRWAADLKFLRVVAAETRPKALKFRLAEQRGIEPLA